MNLRDAGLEHLVYCGLMTAKRWRISQLLETLDKHGEWADVERAEYMEAYLGLPQGKIGDGIGTDAACSALMEWLS